MSVLKRSGGSTIAAISLAVVLFASPLQAQKTILTLTGGTIAFAPPTATDYDAGFKDSPTGVTFTVNAQTGASRTTTISIRSTSASLGGGKASGELQWRRSDLAVWNSITLTDAQVEQRVQVFARRGERVSAPAFAARRIENGEIKLLFVGVERDEQIEHFVQNFVRARVG